MFKKSIPLLLFTAFTIFSIWKYKEETSFSYLAHSLLKNLNLSAYLERGMGGTVKGSPKDNTLVDLEKKADLQFENDPTKAILMYEKILSIDPSNSRVHLKLGIIFCKIEQFEAAKEHLFFVTEDKNYYFRSDAFYFLGLIASVANDKKVGKEYLQICSGLGSQYKSDAIQLMLQL